MRLAIIRAPEPALATDLSVAVDTLIIYAEAGLEQAIWLKGLRLVRQRHGRFRG